MEVPTRSGNAELEIQKSRFIAAALYVETEEAAQAIIRQTRAEHPKSRHIVWAYVIGDEKRQYLGMSDDGEPKGTAGRPALSTLQYSGLTNILVTIVRYFGGIKLGTGGLVKAYTDSVKAVIDTLPRKRLVEEVTLELRFGYGLYESIRLLLEQNNADSRKQKSSTTEVRIKCTVEQSISIQLQEIPDRNSKR